ncbi:MAG: endonuclease [Deltaproteobacteria bacterium]|nr:endonuclease [Deltaproteobacteria bacterium]
MPKADRRGAAAYDSIIEAVFFAHYRKGASSFEFAREELRDAGNRLRVAVPKNLGDVLYTYRYRRALPDAVRQTCSAGNEWIISGVRAGRYALRLVPITRIEPQAGRYRIKVPDATPEIVAQHALSDEQALLARVRYNRLIDIFTGITTYSLQNHLRTQVEGVQIEIDELYLGIGKNGAQYVLPVQAKGGSDRIGRVQLEQDIEYCARQFSKLIARAIAAQLMEDGTIAMFELTVANERVEIVDERHYKLVPASEITPGDLDEMKRREQ